LEIESKVILIYPAAGNFSWKKSEVEIR
jgi:hypothetical protein